MQSKFMVLIVVALVLFVGGTYANNNDQIFQSTIEDDCQSDCGGVQIPYPFGIGTSSKTGRNCFLEQGFQLTCKDFNLYWIEGSPVTGINITQGKLEMMFFVSIDCYHSNLRIEPTKGTLPWLTINAPGFTVASEDNKFISVGCDTYGYLNSIYNNTQYSTGCVTRCYGDSPPISDGHCSGIGCCEVDIPLGMRNISLQTFSFLNFYASKYTCSYSFVVKNGNYTFSKNHLENFPYKTMPMVFDWSVGNETCQESKKRITNVCMGNSTCVDSNTTGYGYRCQCKDGYQGNPYHPHGCTDIDECVIGTHDCTNKCTNILGSYQCSCPKGHSGNGTKEQPCSKENELPKYLIGGSVGLILLVMATSLLILVYQKRKFNEQKKKFFQQNGGLILLQQLQEQSAGKESSQIGPIFTADELKKATNNYDKNLIVGKGGYGIVYKGTLSDNRIVAVKKSKTIDKSQKDEFINEVAVLSQINHRNVVKLIGCCLEEQVPILVYEFVNNGTLFDLIHNKSNGNTLTWETRLRIAVESTEALTYLHAAASTPIVHRDVKSANILLDDNYTAKVSDFGASRLIPLDQIALGTKVQGTFGYLDPEYMQSGQLTDKSDVYSFGVVLLELLTGEKPFDANRSEEKRCLANYFLSCLNEDRLSQVLQVGIMDEENNEEIKGVCVLASKCLGLKGEDRPSMKEVGMELERIRQTQKNSWINEDKNLKENDQYNLIPSSTFNICVNIGETSSSHQNVGYEDSIMEQALLPFDDGR